MSERQELEIANLVSKAEQLLIDDAPAEAYRVARQALHVGPNHASVKHLLDKLQDGAPTRSLETRCEQFVTTGDFEQGRHLSSALKEQTLDEDTGRRCLSSLLDNFRTGGNPQATSMADRCVEYLIKRNMGAKRELVQRLIQHITRTFNRLWAIGEHGLTTMVAMVAKRGPLWQSESEWRTVLQGIFQLLLAKIIAPGQDHAQRSIKCITVLASQQGQHLKDVINADAFAIILELMDVRCPDAVRTMALIATRLLADIVGLAAVEQPIIRYVTREIGNGTNDSLIKAFSAATYMFNIMPKSTFALFTADGFVEGLVPRLHTNSQAQNRSINLELASLEAISAACADLQCRETISRHCIDWMWEVAERTSAPRSSILATLVIVKCYGQTSAGAVRSDSILPNVDHLTDLLIQGLLATSDAQTTRIAVEGLSMVTCIASIKESISNNAPLLRRLAELLPGKDDIDDNWFILSILMTIQHVVDFKSEQTQSEREIERLRAFAEARRPSTSSPLDDDKHVAARCTRIVASPVFPALLNLINKMNTRHKGAMSRILLAASNIRSLRGRLAQMGCVKYLCEMFVDVKRDPEQTDEVEYTAAFLAQSLARILISTNPSHVFTRNAPLPFVVNCLAHLLKVHEPTVMHLATFEGLLALTNVTSMEDTEARDFTIKNYFPSIEQLLLYEVVGIRRAATELVCNVMSSPLAVALYIEPGNPAATRRLRILLALTDSPDRATRLAAGGALANISGYEPGVEAILEQEKGVKMVLGLCQAGEDYDEDALHRGISILADMVNDEGAVVNRARRMVNREGGLGIVTAALAKTSNEYVRKAGAEVIDSLQQGEQA